jgi:signal transduction histidine kinase
MRLPARAALSVFLSALIVLLLAFFLPPLVVDRSALFGHNRGQALAVADSFAAELEAGGEGRALVESYGRRYPYLDFELLDSGLRVLAASRPGPERYSLGELASRLGSGWTAREDAQTIFKELSPAAAPAAPGPAYLLLRLRSPFYLSFSHEAGRFLSRAFLWALLLALAVFAAVLAAFSLPFARRVSLLARRISAFVPGGEALPEAARDETGTIARAFNQMAGRLAASEEERRLKGEAWRATVASISHDLRTPLTAVIGYSETLVSGSYSGEEERLRYEEIIHAKATYMEGLLEGLLEESRPGGAKRGSASEETDLAELSRSIVIEYLDEAERSGFSVEAEIPERGPFLSLDREALSRALRNLFDNAIRYAGGGRLVFGLSEAEGKVRLCLRDFGPGLSGPEAELAFEPYRRGPGARGEGLGLGLPTARSLVRALGGELRLESPGGGGCLFVIELPAPARGAEAANPCKSEV